jgi:hypothetical protein
MTYRALLTSFGEVDQDYELMPTLCAHNMNNEAIEEEEMPILPGQKELRCGANVVGPKGQIYRYLGGATQPCLPVEMTSQVTAILGLHSQNMQTSQIWKRKRKT